MSICVFEDWFPGTASVLGVESVLLPRGDLMWKGLFSNKSYVIGQLFWGWEDDTHTPRQLWEELLSLRSRCFVETVTAGARLPSLGPSCPQSQAFHTVGAVKLTSPGPLFPERTHIQPRLYPQRGDGESQTQAVLEASVHQTPSIAGLACDPTGAVSQQRKGSCCFLLLCSMYPKMETVLRTSWLFSLLCQQRRRFLRQIRY